MAIKNWIVNKIKNDRKKSICVIASLVLLCVFSVIIIKYSSRTKASVYRTDRDGNITRMDEIHVLEIVAREGEQVLGYTVEGQEPISRSNIESYQGPMYLDDAQLDDFKNVTGYDLNREEIEVNGEEQYRYTVISNSLNGTFNDHVLDSSMNKGEIKVRAMQASNVKVSDVDWADLVFINSNDYNNNLLYYYDQFVKNGEGGVEPGQIGEDFGDSFVEKGNVFNNALRKIVNAAGFADKADELSLSQFNVLTEFTKHANLVDEDGNPVAVSNFYEYNTTRYRAAFAALDENYFAQNDTMVDTVKKVNSILDDVNVQQQEEALIYLGSMAGKADIVTDTALNESVKNAFLSSQLSGLFEDNLSAYVERLSTLALGVTDDGLQDLIVQTNIDQAELAYADLLNYKSKISENLTYLDEEHLNEYLSDDDKEKILIDLKLIQQGTVNNNYIIQYALGIFSSSFEFSGSQDGNKFQVLINDVNEKNKLNYINQFANAIESESKLNAYYRNSYYQLDLCGFENYNKYYHSEYMNAMKELLNDPTYFYTSPDKTEIDTNKIEAFFAKINENDLYESYEVQGDIPWKVALEIYNRAQSDEVGLFYNTEILTNKRNGDYTQDLSSAAPGQLNNSNNMYKMLLLLRQIRYEYAQANILNKIDENGIYYPNGIPDANTDMSTVQYVSSWWKETFGNDFTDHTKYLEPDVVGDVYDTSNRVLYNTNYVTSDKRIYSFTGSQFFGGKFFTTGINDDSQQKGQLLETGAVNEQVSGKSDKGFGTNYLVVKLAAWSGRKADTYYIHYVDRINHGYDSVYKELYSAKGICANERSQLYNFPVYNESSYTYFYISDSSEPYLRSNYYSNIRRSAYVSIDSPAVYTATKKKLYQYYVVDNYYDYYGFYPINSKTGLFGLDVTDGTLDEVVRYNGVLKTQFSGLFVPHNPDTDYLEGEYKLYIDDTLVAGGEDNGWFKCNEDESDEIIINDNGRIFVGGHEIPLVDQQGNNLVLAPGSVLRIEARALGYFLRDYRYSVSEDIQKYYFKQTTDSSIQVSNFNPGGNVDYYDHINMKFNFTGMEYVKYYYGNDRRGKEVDDGEVVPLGEDVEAGRTIKVKIEYVFAGETEKHTVETTLSRKKKTEVELDYLSTKTATGDSEIDKSTMPTELQQYTGKVTKGNIIKYLLNVNTELIQNLPIRVLEIQPAANSSEFGVFGNNSQKIAGIKTFLDYLNVDTSEAGIRRLFKQAGISDNNLSNVANYQKLVKFTSMSVREFNTHENDLTADYDVIYIGAQEGNLMQKNWASGGTDTWRTNYTDTTMNGMVYTGIGDIVEIRDFMGGNAASDYRQVSNINNANQRNDHTNWKRFYFDGFTGNSISSWNLDASKNYIIREESTGKFWTRHIGRDITVDRMEELLDFSKSGYAILLDDKIMYCDTDKYIDFDNRSYNASSWRYVDKNSKMYNFVVQLKALGYDATTGKYTGKTTLADGSVVNTFTDGKTYPSVVSKTTAKTGKNPEFLPDSEKLQGGLRFAFNRVGRVQFTLVNTPTKYDNISGIDTTGNMIMQTDEDYRKYSFTLDINTAVSKSWLESNYEYKVYVDKSGIGKFTSDVTFKLNPTVTYSEDGKHVTLTGEWPGNMYGFIPWKVEAYNKNNPNLKFAEIGFSAFEYPEERKQDVYVLWLLYPKSNARQSLSRESKVTLNLSGLISKYHRDIEDAGYRVHILPISYESFSDYYGGNKVTTKVFNEENTQLKIKSFYKDYYDKGYANKIVENIDGTDPDIKFNRAAIKYLTYKFGDNNYEFDRNFYNDMPEDKLFDMIVFGFTDSPNGGDLSSVEALNDVVWFTTEAGKSLLFSHDGDSYTTTINNYKDTNGHIYDGDWDWGKHTTSALRTIIGQDVYGIMKNDQEVEANANNENYNDSRRYLGNAEQWWYRGFAENFTMNFSRHEWKKFYNNIYSANRGRQDGNKSWPQETSRVIKLNKGQITQYPYVMGDTLNVSATHTQYLALNLEDEDTTVWYTLDGNNYYGNYARGDGANNYYLYTNGNVTYSGAGHKPTNEKDNLLFINTIVFAIKAGNFSPQVDILNARNVTEQDGSEQNYIDYYEIGGATVSFRPTDFDSVDDSKPFKSLEIYVDKNNNGKYDDGDLLLNNPSNLLISDENGSPLYIEPTDMVNNQMRTFYITNDNLRNINSQLGGDLFNYKIYIRVTDLGNGRGQNNFKLSFKSGDNKRTYFDLN